MPAGLYLVGTPIGHLGDITLRALQTLASVAHIYAEDTRVSQKLLAAYGLKVPLFRFDDHATAAQRQAIVAEAANKAVALVSDAGLPCINDPGQMLVADCVAAGVAVVPIPGANAALTALMASGLPTEHFYYGGFLPTKKQARQTVLEKALAVPATLIFYDTAPRLPDSLKMLTEIAPNAQVVVARELTKQFETFLQGTAHELLNKFATGTMLKGEIVLLVGEANMTADKAEFDIDNALKQALAQGLSVRDAVAMVVGASGQNKSVIYQRALELKN